MSKTKRKVPLVFQFVNEYCDYTPNYFCYYRRPLTKKEWAIRQKDGYFSKGKNYPRNKKIWNKMARSVERDTLRKVLKYKDYEDFSFDNSRYLRKKNMTWWWY